MLRGTSYNNIMYTVHIENDFSCNSPSVFVCVGSCIVNVSSCTTFFQKTISFYLINVECYSSYFNHCNAVHFHSGLLSTSDFILDSFQLSVLCNLPKLIIITI